MGFPSETILVVVVVFGVGGVSVCVCVCVYMLLLPGWNDFLNSDCVGVHACEATVFFHQCIPETHSVYTFTRLQ